MTYERFESFPSFHSNVLRHLEKAGVLPGFVTAHEHDAIHTAWLNSSQTAENTAKALILLRQYKGY